MRKTTLAAKISAVALIMVVLCSAAVGGVGYAFYRADAVQEHAQRALNIAQSAVAAVDGGAMAATMSTMEQDESWYRSKSILDQIARETGVTYLYVLDRQVGEEMTYYMEGYNPATGDDELHLGALEHRDAYCDELFETLATGEVATTGLYHSAGFGMMVSGFAPVKDGEGQVVGVIGADIHADDINEICRAFLIRIFVVVLIFCATSGGFIILWLRRVVGTPIRALTEASDRIALGNMASNLDIRSNDEIGALADAFSRMVESTREQAALLEQMAQGDFSLHVEPRCPEDVMSHALGRMIHRLNEMFADVQVSAGQVSVAATQMAQGAQSLAAASSEQAASLEMLGGAMSEILTEAEENSQQSSTASGEMNQVVDMMQQSIASMEELSHAMAQISDSSGSITRIIKVIDDIAFQTNILALNAAVEASRAGSHGRGFAVVADEVRNLASKSAAAAKETAQLIEDSSALVARGSHIAEGTRASLSAAGEIAGRSAAGMEKITAHSEHQSASISEVNAGVCQVSAVVQQNSATAEESAAASQEMAAQAALLRQVVARFRLHGNGNFRSQS